MWPRGTHVQSFRSIIALVSGYKTCRVHRLTTTDNTWSHLAHLQWAKCFFVEIFMKKTRWWETKRFFYLAQSTFRHSTLVFRKYETHEEQTKHLLFIDQSDCCSPRSRSAAVSSYRQQLLELAASLSWSMTKIDSLAGISLRADVVYSFVLDNGYSIHFYISDQFGWNKQFKWNSNALVWKAPSYNLE
jgi:hypothetical protein